MASFNPLRPAYLADPYPYLARLRETEPVHYSPDMQGWVITRYADCERIFKDDEAFSSDPGRAAGGLGESVRMSRGCAALGGAPILANTDPPEHTRLRAVLSRAFAAREMASRKPDVERTVRGLLADIPAGRPTDFMKALAEPLPLVVVLELLGIPPEDRGAFREAVVGIMRGRMEASANAAAAQASYIAGRNLRSLLLERGAREGVGLVARLAEEMEEGGLAEDELLMVVVHIATAGNAATAFALGNMLLALAQDPEVWSELRSDPELAPGAVDEALRYDSPTHITTRFALAETPLCGRKIRPGQAVHLVVAAANRDPEEFAEPDVFDIHRKSRQLAFGLGIHFCLGAPLGRMELEVSLREMVSRYAEVRVAPGGYEPGGTLLLRGPRRLVLEGREG